MPSIELTAKSIEDAKKSAATKLGVSADQVTITVLEESKGLFGKVNLKVRADVAEVEAAAPAPVAAPKAAKKVAEPAAEAPAAPAAEEKAGAPRRKLGAKVSKPAEEEAAPVAAAEPAKPAKPAPKAKKAEAAPAAEAAPPTEEAPKDEESKEDEVVATQEDADKILGIVNALLAKSNLEVEMADAGIQGKYINLSIDGKDTAYMVGKHGEVINALQYLINLTVKQQMGNGVRVVLDGNDYRKRRETALTGLASRIAEQVKERGEEAVLDALPAFERRIIHKALVEIPGVVTYSEGEEPNRRVVIAPAE